MERVLARNVASDLRRRLSLMEQSAVSGAECYQTARYITSDPSNPGGGRADCPCLDCSV